MRVNRDYLIAVLMIAPSLVLLGIFVYGFIGQSLYWSFTDWGRDPFQALALDPQLRWVGLDNYVQLFTSPIDVRFRQDLVNMVFFTIFFLTGCLGLGLGLAILLDQNVRMEGFFRTTFLFPMSLSFIVTGTIWRWMLQPRGGVNVLPTTIGLEPFTFGWLTSREQIWRFDWQNLPVMTGFLVAFVLLWVAWSAYRSGAHSNAGVALVSALLVGGWSALGGPGVEILPYPEMKGFNLALIGVILAAVWQMAGYTMALYLAGLRGVSAELREAARVDGASEGQLYRHVVLPLLKPITLSAMIILGHISLKIFDLVFAMAGPDNARVSVPALLMYTTAFRGNQFAKGAAIAMILLLLVAVIIVPYLWSQLRSERKS
jgi:glucose/mannose transport system permease protein